jgi:cbb3-type cytochrome oxidase subunit 3
VNPLRSEAALYVEYAWVMGVMTALFLLCFVGWIWWAWADGNRGRIEAAARMPLAEDDE